MSESKKIADHEDALGIYFDEMLQDTTAETLKNKAHSSIIKPTSKHDENSSFQALLFDINGLQLALRTEEIKAILPWPETPFEQNIDAPDNEAIIGSYNQAPHQIKIIDTAHIVLPLQHRDNLAIPSFMIVVGKGNWALSCHKINAIITLSPEDIHWRKNIGSRPWLAGTSIEKNCSIVNLSGLVNLLTPQLLA